MAGLAYLVSSARQLLLRDGTTYPAGYLTLGDLLWPYERFVGAGLDTTVITPDGVSPTTATCGAAQFFDCSDEDARYVASVVRTFARHAEDIRVTLHDYVDLGLVAARHLDAKLQEHGMQPEQAYLAVAAAARLARAQDRPLAEVLAEDPTIDVGFGELQEAAVAQRAQSEKLLGDRRAQIQALPAWQEPVALSAMTDADVDRFDALFVPGGYGSMVDLCDHPQVRRLVAALDRRAAPIAVVGHGVAALLSAPDREDGQWLFEGYRMTSITDDEEDQTPAGQRDMAWRTDVALKDAGAIFDDGPAAWTSHVVIDRNLISGQNPASTPATVRALLAMIGAEAPPLHTVSGPFLPEVTIEHSGRTAEETVRVFLDAIAGRRLDAAMCLVAPQAKVIIHPRGSAGAGPALLHQVLSELLTGMPDLRLDVDRMIVSGDTVTALFRAQGTQTAVFEGIPPLNRHLDIDQAWRVVVAGGLIIEVAAYWCQAQIYRRLGVRRYDEIAIA